MAGNPYDQFDGPVANPYDQFDEGAVPEKDPGYLGEVARGLKHGAAVTLPKAIGQAAQFAGFDSIGDKIVKWAESNQNAGNVESAEGQKHPEWYSVRGNVYEAADNSLLSLAPGAAGAAVGAGVGSVVPGVGTALGALVGYGVGSIAALPIFYGSQGQETYEKVKKAQLEAGATPEVAEAEARKAGHFSGAIEAGGEAAQDVIPFAKLARPFTKPAAVVAGSIVKDTFFPGWKGAAKTLAKVEAGEVGTEMAQQAGESAVEGAYGAGPGATWADTAQVIMPTALMTLIPGGAGAGAHHLKLAGDAKALSDPATPQDVRAKIALGAASAMQEADPNTARAFSAYAAEQIKSGAPIDLAGDELYHQHVAKAAPDPVTRILDAGSVDEAVAAAVAAIDEPAVIAEDAARFNLSASPSGLLAQGAAASSEPFRFDPTLQGQQRPDEAELQRPPAPVEAPAIALPNEPAAPAQVVAPTRTTREAYTEALVKSQRGELLTAYERMLIAHPPSTPELVIEPGSKTRTEAPAAVAAAEAPAQNHTDESQPVAAPENLAPAPQERAAEQARPSVVPQPAPVEQAVSGEPAGAVPRAATGGDTGSAALPAGEVAPKVEDYTAPKAVPSKKLAKGDVLTFKTERGAALYAKSNKLAGYEPRQQGSGWVLSKPSAPTAPAVGTMPHMVEVADAIARGETVAPAVLAHYPALAELAKAKSTLATQQTSPSKAAPKQEVATQPSTATQPGVASESLEPGPANPEVTPPVVETPAKAGVSASAAAEATTEKPTPAPKNAEALGDFGEKIGGARKDMWRERGLNTEDLEGMSGGEQAQYATKDNVWPKIDYAKMIAGGTEPKAAALLKIVRDRLAAKPRRDTTEGRRDYVEMVSRVRRLTETGPISVDMMRKLGELVQQEMGLSSNMGVDRYKPENRAKFDKLFAIYKGRQSPFHLTWLESRRADRMLEEGWPKAKARDEAAANKGPALPERPHLDTLKRTGQDVRAGRNVTSKEFTETFGFRGVEFGNWAANDERQRILNMAFDALHDLGSVIGVPPKAISLDGTLGLALAARGGGKAAAHYEPGKLVINMTKLRGAGSLAHEWGHALDHYFGEIEQPNAYQGHARGASGWYTRQDYRDRKMGNMRPEVAEAFNGVMRALFMKSETKADLVRAAELRIERTQARLDQVQATDKAMYERSLQSQKQALAETRRDMADGERVFSGGNSSYAVEAMKLSGKAGASGYWARPTEMFARAFESYVFDKVRSDENVSDYLVHGVEADRYATGYRGNPYPAGVERDVMRGAFDKLFEAIETKGTPRGIAMYSQGEATSGSKVPAVRKWLANVMVKSRTPITIVQTREEAQAQTGLEVAADAKGVYHEGRIWVIADNIADALDAEKTVARHELVHAGYDALYGGDVRARERALNTLITKNRNVREQADKWLKRYGEQFIEDSMADDHALTREAAAREMVLRSKEEGVAYFSQESKPLNGWQQFMAVIQQGLRRMGFTRLASALEGMTNAEAQKTISELLRATEETPVELPTGAQPAFARTGKENLDRLALAQKFMDDMVARIKDKTQRPDRGAILTRVTPNALQTVGAPNLPLHLPGTVAMKAVGGETSTEKHRYTQTDPAMLSRIVEDIFEPVMIFQSSTEADSLLILTRERDSQEAPIIVVVKKNGSVGREQVNVITSIYPRQNAAHMFETWAKEGKLLYHDREKVAQIEAAAPSTTVRLQLPWVVQLSATAGKTVLSDETVVKRYGGMFSRSGFTKNPTGWVANESPEMQETLRKAGAWRPQIPLSQRIVSWTADWQTRLKQGMVDQFDPIKSLDYHAYMLARMSKSSAGPLETMLLDGTVYLDKDGAVDVNYEKGGFVGLMQKLQGEHDRFFSWVIGNRAERLLAEEKERNLTPEDIARLKSLNKGKMADGKSREAVYLQALADLNRYNKAAVDMAEKAGLIDRESRALWEKDFYIPFYRMTEGDQVKGPRPKAGLVRQYAFKTLKGGAEAIGDPMENILKNWAHLIDASLKNNAARASVLAAERAGVAIEAKEEEARQMAKAMGKKDTVVHFMDEGRERYFVIDDPFVLDAINSMSFSGFSGTGMKVMSTFKHWLTYGVTISPTFRIRNVLRDSIAMIGANPASYNALSNVLTGWKMTKEGSPVYSSMIAGGGVMRYGSFMEGDNGRNVKRLIDAGVDSATILDSTAKTKAMLRGAYDWWMHVGDRSENVNRAALYQQLRDQGKSHLEASYAARDTMDFSMQGTWAAIRFLTQTVPFFNARLQGLYKLGRGAAEDPRRFAYVVGAAALASIALLLAYKDDDDWKRREDWDRESFWWFKVGDKAFRIPKPFEIGAIGTLAERAVELFATNELTGKQFVQRMGSVIGQQLSMNPVPQLFMPVAEVWANQNTFTNRPIESQGMEKLSPSQRSGPDTSIFAQLAGKNGVVSPVQIDHLISGYFGWLGMHVVATADMALRPATGAPGKPTPKIDDLFVVGDFVRGLPQYQSKYLTRLYDQGKEVQQLMADLHQMQKVGAIEKAAEFLQDNRDKLKLYTLYNTAERQLSAINQQIKMVQLRDGDATVKRERLDQLYAMRNRVAELTEQRVQSLTQ